ncbi:MAG TPA: hypothetical protein VJ779_20200 [Acetobacteraceae bacterium]|nr:hypothetical protein [Acetobacteraceae bacterium]
MQLPHRGAGLFQIVRHLKIHPELGTRAEEAREADCCLGGDGTPTRTISVMRFEGTPNSAARARPDKPRGAMKSSFNTMPGCTGPIGTPLEMPEKSALPRSSRWMISLIGAF